MKLRLAVVPLLLVLLPMTAAAAVKVDLAAGRQLATAGDVLLFGDGNDAWIDILPYEGWLVRKVRVYFGKEMVPLTRWGNPKIGQFPIKKDYNEEYAEYVLVALEGQCAEGLESGDLLNVAVHADLVKGESLVGAWAEFEIPFAVDRLRQQSWGFFGTLTRDEICSDP